MAISPQGGLVPVPGAAAGLRARTSGGASPPASCSAGVRGRARAPPSWRTGRPYCQVAGAHCTEGHSPPPALLQTLGVCGPSAGWAGPQGWGAGRLRTWTGGSAPAPRPHPLAPSRSVVPVEGEANRLAAQLPKWKCPVGLGVAELHCHPDDSGHPVPCESLPLPALLGVGAKGPCSSLTLSFSSCFEKSLVAYLRETGRNYVPRMPGRCFPSASQQIFSLKGDGRAFSLLEHHWEWPMPHRATASWGQGGTDPRLELPALPGQPEAGSQAWRSLSLSHTHTCSEHFRGPPGRVGRGCSLGTVWT